MARNPQQKDDAAVAQVIGNHTLEPIPEQGLTEAAAAAMSPVFDKGEAKGLTESTDAPKIKVVRYRVLEDRNISSNGSRALMRAGKEFDDRQYNPEHLKRQGVKIEKIEEFEV